MAKFCGKVGFSLMEETAPGVWKNVPKERSYKGDVTRNYYRWQDSENLNDNFTMSNTISIVSDAFAYNNLAFITYVNWMGARWKVTGVEVQRPRILLTLGGVYSGEVPIECECGCEKIETPRDL